MNISGISRIKILIVIVFISGCTSIQTKKTGLKINYEYCAPAVKYNYDSLFLPLPTNEVLTSKLAEKYTTHTILTSNAAGIIPYLETMDSIERNPSGSALINNSHYIYIKQKILLRLFLVSSEISSMAAELDCEGERVSQIANFLKDKELKRAKLLTVLSITSGAITGIITSVGQNSNSKGTIVAGVAGGTVSAILGLSTLFFNKKINFKHQRNLLTDIWFGPLVSKDYPPSIWYMLNENLFSNSQQNSIRINVKERWENMGFKEDKKQIQLFFLEGGLYTSEELSTRSDMLDEVQSAIRLFHQDIQSLILLLSKE